LLSQEKGTLDGGGGEKQSSDAIIKQDSTNVACGIWNKLGAWSQPTGREHEVPRARIAMRPELARSGLFNSMMGKFLRKIGRGRQCEQHKKSAYMGKEEVRERIWFVGRVEGREGFRVRDINWGFMTRRTWAGEQEVQREGLEQR
jgi:hypothetical protein